MTATPAVGLISLGCAKNLVDSERLASALVARGYRVSGSYDDADVVVVNTCGFINSARDESHQAISEALHANGRVIVFGCLGAEREALLAAFPQVLAVHGPAMRASVLRSVARAVGEPPIEARQRVGLSGLRLTPRHYAYVKIAEGCSNRCTFCIIPSLRGPQVSRTPQAILSECRDLIARGTRELLIISQDSSAYGSDLADGQNLAALCRELAGLGVWVRLHYVYPGPQADHAVEQMAEGGILPYLDVPFQHASPRILKLMRRPHHLEHIQRSIERWRGLCPDLVIRSTFITGFPGEEERDFELLLEFLRTAQLDRVGCFAYSPVQGAAANELPGAVPAEVAEERRARLMGVQESISAARLRRRVGSTCTLLIDDITEDGAALARSYGETPDADGIIALSGAAAAGLRAGAFVQARITGSTVHDLQAELLTAARLGSIHFKQASAPP